MIKGTNNLNGVSRACRLWPKIESWLGSLTILRGSGPVWLINLYFCDVRGEVRTPCPHSGSALTLHPPVSKSRASVLLISSALVYAPLHHKWTNLCRMIPLLFAQLCTTVIFYFRRIGLYLYNYRIYGTISIYKF